MFKNRAMMSGIGIGLIVGAVLLQLMLVSRNADTKSAAPAPAAAVKPDELDQKQLKEVASRYYQLFDKSEKVYTQAEVEQKMKDALKSQPNSGSAAAPAPEGGKKVAVYISQGLIAKQVAELLYRSGVIADRNAFEKMLNDQQITNKIQAGYHLFEGNPDPQQVIATLIAPQ